MLSGNVIVFKCSDFQIKVSKNCLKTVQIILPGT